MEPTTFEADKEEGLDISFDLEEDTVRGDELSSSGPRGRSTVDEKYRIAEQQLLQEGRLGDAEISARIQKATFGVFNEQPACLIHLGLDFCPKNGKAFFRFRSATITVEFEEVVDTIPSQKEEKKDPKSGKCSQTLVRPSTRRIIKGI